MMYAEYLKSVLVSDDIQLGVDGDVYGRTGDWRGERYLIRDRGSVDNLCWIQYTNDTFSVESGYENWPIVWVSWYGAKSFAKFYGLDLPREAEWEYACRGSQQYKYGTDDGTISINTVNNGDTGIEHPVSVGSYPDNPFGLYDMSGNVWEWCSDWYGDYSSGSAINPTGALTGDYRVIRGGSWEDDAYDCRSANRSDNRSGMLFKYDPGHSEPHIGFRVVSR